MAKKITTIEGLAETTQKEFLEVGKKFERVGERFDSLESKMQGGFQTLTSAITKLATAMEDGFAHVNARIDTLHSDISDLPVMREELHGLRQRVERLERKVGVR